MSFKWYGCVVAAVAIVLPTVFLPSVSASPLASIEFNPQKELSASTHLERSVEGGDAAAETPDVVLEREGPERIPLPGGDVWGTPPEWTVGPLGVDTDARPAWSGDRYVVPTAYGEYLLDPQTASFELRGADGGLAVTGSHFAVEVDGVMTERSASRLQFEGDTVVMDFDVIRSAEVWGGMAVSFDFATSGPPKITAEATPSRFASGEARIVWVLDTSFETVRVDESTFALLPEEGGEVPLRRLGTRMTLGTRPTPFSWSSGLSVDWTGESGEPSMSRTEEGVNRIFVRFPTGKLLIDPYLVADPIDDGGLSGATQRKVFFAQDRVWVFYLEGGDIYVRSGRHVVRLGSENLVWDPAHLVAQGVQAGFDVANEGGRVALAYRDDDSKLYCQPGQIVNNQLLLASPEVVDGSIWPKSPPSLALGPDGSAWLSYWHSVGGQLLRVPLKDCKLWYSWWFDATNDQTYSTMLPLPEGRAFLVYFVRQSGTLYWRAFDPHKAYGGQWTGLGSYPADIDWSYGADAFSAVAHRRSESQASDAHVVFRRAATGQIEYLRIRVFDSGGAGSVDTTAILSSSGPEGEWPTVSIDANGDLHAMWAETDASLTQLYEARSAPGGVWDTFPPWKPAQPFLGTTSIERTHLSTGYRSDGTLYAVWQERVGANPPTAQLGFFPLPFSSTASDADPWSRPGLSTEGPFVSQGDEHIAVGSGKLIVRQTDVSVPGRKLGLEISRVYVQPEVLAGYAPYGYDDYPWAPMGPGWRLNLPWITDTFVYWLDGQRYLIKWDENKVFENHAGAHFRLLITSGVYRLDTPGGLEYEFSSSGSLTKITDTFGNQITFTYSSGKLSLITDTIGRTYVFTYDAGAGGNLKTIAYAGRTVTYEYMAGALGYSLVSVIDPEGRVTQFGYAWGMSQYLLNRIDYPTGGHTSYNFGARLVGSDTWTHVPISQDVYESQDLSNLVHSTAFSYELVAGKVRYAKVEVSDGLSIQGTTEYHFRPHQGLLETRLFDGAGNHMRTIRSWSSPAGDVSHQQTFLASAVDPDYSSLVAYDDWGNPVYTKDASGHETFATYANTESQNAFRAPGQFDRTDLGRLFHDDFSDRDFSDWTISESPPATSAELDLDVFHQIAPSVKLSTTAQGWFVQMDQAPLPCNTDTRFFEFIVRPGEVADSHDVVLAGSASERVRLRFDNSGELKYLSSVSPITYSSFDNPVSYRPGWWFRLGIQVYMDAGNFVWDFWLDGNLHQSGLPTMYPLACGVGAFGFYVASSSQASVSMWVAEAKAYESRDLTVTGLQSGQAVRLRSWDGAIVGQAKVAGGASTATISAKPYYPDVRIEVLGVDLTLEASTPFLYIWGGDTYAYDPSWELSGLTRTTNGFTRPLSTPNTVYLDDVLPSNPTLGGNEAWDWIENGEDGQPLPVSGTRTHTGDWGWWDQDHSYYHTDIGQYSQGWLVQYVYIPSGQTPDELMLEYYVCDPQCTWEHRAYWGENFLPRGTDGTQSRRYMDAIPDRSDQWLMLVMSTYDVNEFGDQTKGIGFVRHGGNATWDFSASKGDMDRVTVNGVASGWRVELWDEDLTSMIVGTDAFGPSVILDLYSAGVRAFPIAGKFKIFSPGAVLEYVSPAIENLWAGDVLDYSNPGFYANENLITSYSQIHNRPVGTLGFQTGRGASPEVPQATYTDFDTSGFARESKRSHGAGWITTRQTPDGFGNDVTATDPGGHVTTKEYSAGVCGSAYVWKETRVVGGQSAVTEYGYDCDTGLVVQVTTPRGYATDYSYDDVGRTVSVTYPAVGGIRDSVSYVYDDANNVVTFIDEVGDRSEGVYDGLGRLIETRRLYDDMTVYSVATRSYNWQGLVASEETPEGITTSYEYDLLGRLTKVVNEDSTFVQTSYQDLPTGTTQTIIDEVGDKREYVGDLSGNLRQVREYLGLNPFNTFYDYDAAGNLLTVRDPKAPSEVTTHTYDDLNRVVLTTYPDAGTLAVQYDDDGEVISRTDGLGTATFTYDEFHRLTEADFPDGLAHVYDYDLNSNLLSASSMSSLTPPTLLGASTVYVYDERDRPVEQHVGVLFDDTTPCGLSVTNPIPLRPFLFTWTPDGNLESLTYPDGLRATYVYDDFNRPITVVGTGGSRLLDSVTYDRDDRITSLDYGNPVGVPSWSTSLSYDARGRIQTIDHKKDAVSQLQLTYSYYDDGNVQTVNNGGTVESYVYDSLDRLMQATGGWGSLGFTYDGAGNRKTKTENGIQSAYIHGAYNRLDEIKVGGATSVLYAYDANGNAIWKRNVPSDDWVYQYDATDQMGSVEHPPTNVVQCNGYDAEGRRVRIEKPPSGTRLRDLWIDNLLVAEEDIVGGTSEDFVYLGGKLVARVGGAETHFYLQDHIGSTRLVARNSDGATVFSASYEPFGVEIPGTGQESIKYIQRQNDEGSEYYLLRRFYDADIGRFLSEDPLLGSLRGPQTHNRYAYAVNNPLRYTDPDGECATLCTAAIGAVAGFLIGGIGCWIGGGEDCWKAALAGAAVGFLAGLTFGASLYAAGAMGAGTAVAGGGFTFSGIGAAGAIFFAGSMSGAVSGLGGYIADSLITGSPMTLQGAARATLIGLIVGGLTAVGSYGIGRAAGLIPQAFTFAPRVPDNYVVVRGGKDPLPGPGVKFSGSAAATADEAAAAVPQYKLWSTTAGAIRQGGGKVWWSYGTTRGINNPFHVDVILGGGPEFAPWVLQRNWIGPDSRIGGENWMWSP